MLCTLVYKINCKFSRFLQIASKYKHQRAKVYKKKCINIIFFDSKIINKNYVLLIQSYWIRKENNQHNINNIRLKSYSYQMPISNSKNHIISRKR